MKKIRAGDAEPAQYQLRTTLAGAIPIQYAAAAPRQLIEGPHGLLRRVAAPNDDSEARTGEAINRQLDVVRGGASAGFPVLIVVG